MRQVSRLLNGRCPRRRGRPAQHLAAIWGPYTGIGPTRQVVNVVMDATTPCTHPAPVHSLPLSLSLSRLRWRKRHHHCRRKLRELLAPSYLRLTSPPSVSKSASSSSIFSTSWLDEISPRWSTFREIAVVWFTAVATPIPTNLAAAPSLSSFFSPSRVSACLGQGRGLCHAILALVSPSCRNAATAPPRSPPTTTPHMSRLTGAIRVRRFYLESSALSHWCLSRPSPTFYRSEMAGVSRGISVVPLWLTATPLRRSNPRATYLYRRGITQGSCWCPWVRHRSSPSVFSVFCFLWVFSVFWDADTRVPMSVTQRLPPLFYLKSRFLAILQESYLQFLSSKICKTNFMMIHGMATF